MSGTIPVHLIDQLPSNVVSSFTFSLRLLFVGVGAVTRLLHFISFWSANLAPANYCCWYYHYYHYYYYYDCNHKYY